MPDQPEPPRFTWAEGLAAHPKQGEVIVPITSPDGHDAELWIDQTEAQTLHDMLDDALGDSAVTRTCSDRATETEPNNFVQVGWYCWRCQAINTQACRSDSVPIHAPAEWADEMQVEIARRDEGDDTTPAEEGAADRRYWNSRYDQEGS